MTRPIGLPIAVAFLLLAPRPSAAQGGGGGAGATAVYAVQAMQFGLLVPSVAERVTIQQGWRRGEVRLEGTGNLEIRIVLPTQLQSGAGATIPLTFVDGDAGYQLDGSATVTPFDPNQIVRINLKKNVPGARLFLGGTATPAATQAAGSYSGTIVVLFAPPNF